MPELFTLQNLVGRAVATMLANVTFSSDDARLVDSGRPCGNHRRSLVTLLVARGRRCSACKSITSSARLISLQCSIGHHGQQSGIHHHVCNGAAIRSSGALEETA